MRKIFILLYVLTFSNICSSQTVLQQVKYTSVTKDNAENNNGAYASVRIDYLVRSVDKNEVFINTSVSDFTINATQGYGYNGKIYRNEVPGLMQALGGARASNPTVTFKIYYAGNMVDTRTVSITAVNNLNGFSGDGFSIPASEAQIKNPNWTLEAIALNSFSINPDGGTYAEIINKYLKLLSDKDAYKKQISDADKALYAANTGEELLAARAEYNKALSLSPNESYPLQKIQNINNKISNLRKENERKEEEELKKRQEEKIAKEADEKKKSEEEKSTKDEQEKKETEKSKAETVKKEKKEITEEERDEQSKRNTAASKFEVDGDELRYSDPVAAKQNYEQAQLINYTNRVAQKIKDLKTNLQVNAGIEAIKGIDKLTDQLDPNGNTRSFVSFSGFDGLMANNEKLNKNYLSKPWNLNFFGVRISALFLALELRLGYFNSPYYEFEVKNNKDVKKVIDKVAIQQQALSTGLSAGLNFRIQKNIIIYGLYGVEWLGPVTSRKMQEGKGYSFDENDYHPKFPDFVFVLSSGIDYHIPKTKVGIGVRYNLNRVLIKPKEANIKIKGGADSRYQYFMDKISSEKVEFNNLGIRLIWSWD